MVLCDDTETSASSHVHIQTLSDPGGYDGGINYDDSVNLSKKIKISLPLKFGVDVDKT